MEDSLTTIVLGKPWCGQPAGSSVEVDAMRGAAMRDEGFEVVPEEVQPQAAPITPKSRKSAVREGR